MGAGLLVGTAKVLVLRLSWSWGEEDGIAQVRNSRELAVFTEPFS